MVSALYSGSLGGPGSSLAVALRCVFWARHFTLILPLFTQGSVGQKVDNAILRINRYPVDKC